MILLLLNRDYIFMANFKGKITAANNASNKKKHFEGLNVCVPTTYLRLPSAIHSRFPRHLRCCALREREVKFILNRVTISTHSKTLECMSSEPSSM